MVTDLQKASLWKRFSAGLLDLILLAVVAVGAAALLSSLLGYNEKNDQLINPVEITLGCSDGIHAEVLSGLSVEDTFWYSYYDTLEIDYSVEDPVFGFG